MERPLKCTYSMLWSLPFTFLHRANIHTRIPAGGGCQVSEKSSLSGITDKANAHPFVTLGGKERKEEKKKDPRPPAVL